MSYLLNIWNDNIDYYVTENGTVHADDETGSVVSGITVYPSNKTITITEELKSTIGDSFRIDDSDGTATTEYMVQVGEATNLTYSFSDGKIVSDQSLPARFEPASNNQYVYKESSDPASIEITGLTEEIFKAGITVSGNKIKVKAAAVEAIGNTELKITSPTDGYTFEFDGYNPKTYSGNTWVDSGSGVYTLYQDGGSYGAVISGDGKTLSMGTATALATITITDTADLSKITLSGSDISFDGTKIVSESNGTVYIENDISNLIENDKTMSLDFASSEACLFSVKSGISTTASADPTATFTVSGSDYTYTIAEKNITTKKVATPSQATAPHLQKISKLRAWQAA